MRVALPPPKLPKDFNTKKQRMVFDLVHDPSHDVVLHPVELKDTDLEAVHDKAYVRPVMRLEEVNGWGDCDPNKLRHVLHSCGAMLAAVRAAASAPLGEKVAFAPVSGFHHAGYQGGWGFCTFNGLALAANWFCAHFNINAKVLIIDGDGHHGDGTENIRRTLGWEWLTNLTLAGGYVRNHLDAQRLINRELTRQAWDLVLYQAGADCHEEDPYGAGYLSDEQWDERDALVFKLCKQLGHPVVWNLAGGYNGRKTISLHTRTFETALRVYYPGQVRRPAAPDVPTSLAASSGPQQ